MINHKTDLNGRVCDIATREAEEIWQEPTETRFFETIWLTCYKQILFEFTFGREIENLKGELR